MTTGMVRGRTWRFRNQATSGITLRCARPADAYSARRFLKARGWDLQEAKRMWMGMLTWRIEWGADGILDSVLMSDQQQRRLQAIYPHGLHGVDMAGHPVLIYRLGMTDTAALKKEFSETLLRKFHVQTQEFIMRVVLPACSLAANTHVDQVTTVVDLEGMGLW
jgi:hypothetical protein